MKKRVAMKRIKEADKFRKNWEVEHLLNVKVAMEAPSSCVPYMGCCDVGPEEKQTALMEGLWMVSSCVWYVSDICLNALTTSRQIIRQPFTNITSYSSVID